MIWITICLLFLYRCESFNDVSTNPVNKPVCQLNSQNQCSNANPHSSKKSIFQSGFNDDVKPHKNKITRHQFIKCVGSSSLFFGLSTISSIAEAQSETNNVPSFKQDLWYDIDGAVGIKWGAKDTCNPAEDADCGINGMKVDLSAAQPIFAQHFFPVSERCLLMVDINGQTYEIEVGLWREAAPKSVDLFAKMCASEYILDDDDFPGLSVGYAGGAYVNEVKRNEKITFASTFTPSSLKGRRKKTDISDLQSPQNFDKNDLVKHQAAGLLSLKKNGGSFEFVITPRANRRLDKDYIVIGQVLNGMDVVERINQAAVNKYKNAPLKKILITECTVN